MQFNQFMPMSVVRISTNFNIELDFISPPFYKRLLAWMVDMVILIFYIFVASEFYQWFSAQSYSKNASVNLWAIGLVLLLPLLLYHVVCEVTMNGQSIGKKIMHIRVINENGGRPGLGQFIIRWLIRTSDFTLFLMIIMIPYAQYYGPQIYWAFGGAVALLITDIVLVNSKKQQRLGDIVAHTLLISTKQKETINDTVFLEVAPSYVPSFPQVMHLSDRDMNALKGILDAAKKRHDYTMAELAGEKIKTHLKIETTLSPFDFLEVLLKDYNYLSVN